MSKARKPGRSAAPKRARREFSEEFKREAVRRFA
jgi:transposase-like protein